MMKKSHSLFPSHTYIHTLTIHDIRKKRECDHSRNIYWISIVTVSISHSQNMTDTCDLQPTPRQREIMTLLVPDEVQPKTFIGAERVIARALSENSMMTLLNHLRFPLVTEAELSQILHKNVHSKEDITVTDYRKIVKPIVRSEVSSHPLEVSVNQESSN